MGEKEETENNEKNADRCDMISARAALLDYFGDSALSFSNQLIASIFGLVASCAIIQSVFGFLLSEDNPLIVESLVFFFLSLVLFGGFSYMVNYTFNKFTFYSSLTSNLTGGKGGIWEQARLNELYVLYSEKAFRRDKNSLENSRKFLIETEQMAENEKWFTKEKNGIYVKYLVHSTHYDFKYKKIWWRNHFKGIMGLALILLAIVTYYPLIVEVIQMVL